MGPVEELRTLYSIDIYMLLLNVLQPAAWR